MDALPTLAASILLFYSCLQQHKSPTRCKNLLLMLSPFQYIQDKMRSLNTFPFTNWYLSNNFISSSAPCLTPASPFSSSEHLNSFTPVWLNLWGCLFLVMIWEVIYQWSSQLLRMIYWEQILFSFRDKSGFLTPIAEVRLRGIQITRTGIPPRIFLEQVRKMFWQCGFKVKTFTYKQKLSPD